MKNKMQFFILVFFLCISQVFSQKGKTETYHIQHDGMDREYIIHIPESYDGIQKVPLVLQFHGYTANAKQHMRYSHFNAISDKENFIVVYPQGTKLEGKTHWNVGGWTLASTTDDVAFIDELLNFLCKEYTIDETRMYSGGMSNGGYMSFLLACQLSHRIAAVSSVVGSMTPQTFDACDPEHPIPVLQFHGTADPTVPYKGAELWSLSIEDVVGYWTGFNKTETNPIVTKIPSRISGKKSVVEKYSYTNGNKNSEVIHYKVLGGKHDWFGTWGNKDINASELMWEFFSQYNINGKIKK